MIIMVKSMTTPTKKTASVADAGTTVESKKATFKTGSPTVSAEWFSKMALFSKECGLKAGDMARDMKSLMIVPYVLASGKITDMSSDLYLSFHENTIYFM